MSEIASLSHQRKHSAAQEEVAIHCYGPADARMESTPTPPGYRSHSPAPHPEDHDVPWSNQGTPYVGGVAACHEVNEDIGGTRCSTVLDKRAGYKMSEN